MNRLVHAEASAACAFLEAHEKFDFVYLDPPYGVGTIMTARTAKGETRGAKQRSGGPNAYDDSRTIPDLVDMIGGVVVVLREHMSERATLVLHLDHRAVHDVKVAIDKLLGRRAFLGEIIWVPGNGGRGERFSTTHQTLLLYARGPKERAHVTYNGDHPQMREPYADVSLAMHFTHTDEAGRRYRERHLGGKVYRYYADQGKKRDSVWTDIPAMVANTPIHKEATGYPTQKPLKLLERLILGFSRQHDLVADLMCGSGTTLVAAALHGRRFFGSDESPQAIGVVEQRFHQAGIAFQRLT